MARIFYFKLDFFWAWMGYESTNRLKYILLAYMSIQVQNVKTLLMWAYYHLSYFVFIILDLHISILEYHENVIL